MFMKRWFHSVGPYKGTLRKTSAFPHQKDSVQNILRLDHTNRKRFQVGFRRQEAYERMHDLSHG